MAMAAMVEGPTVAAAVAGAQAGSGHRSRHNQSRMRTGSTGR